MRTARRNRRKLWYALYEGETDEYAKDKNGKTITVIIDGEEVPKKTGRKTAKYGTPVKFYANIQSSGGEAVSRAYGVSKGDYDATMYLPVGKYPIDETSLIWLDTTPVTDDEGNADPNSADYLVRRVPVALNETLYLLQRRNKGNG